jgi:hypothetical protein
MGYHGPIDHLDVYRELAMVMYDCISFTSTLSKSSDKDDQDATAEILASLHSGLGVITNQNIGARLRTRGLDIVSYGAEVVTDEVRFAHA